MVAVGKNNSGQCDVSGWTDIVAFSTGSTHTVGLKSDGTVVAVGSNGHGMCNVSDWTDIVAFSASYDHTVGLRADGTVVAVGYNEFDQCNTSDWKDIVAVSAGYRYTVGLKSDGTVVATGSNYFGQCNISDWKDIMAISASDEHLVGLKSDGTVVAAGWNKYNQCDVGSWKNIKLPSSIKEGQAMQNAVNQSVKPVSTEDVQSVWASGNSDIPASSQSHPAIKPTESTAPSSTPVNTIPTDQTISSETSPAGAYWTDSGSDNNYWIYEPSDASETTNNRWWLSDEIIPDEGYETAVSGK